MFFFFFLCGTCPTPQLGNSAKRDSTGVDNDPDDMDVSRTQMEENPQEEVDLFDDGDRAHHNNNGTQTLNADLADSQHGLGKKINTEI